MKLLGVLDCARDPDYFPAMLASADWTTWPGPKVLMWSGPEPRLMPPDWDVVARPKKDGLVGPTWDLFRLALERGAAELLVLENDSVLGKDALVTMATVGVPDDCACLSFWDGYEVPAGSPPGIYRIPFFRRGGGRLNGLVAVKFPRRTLEILVASPKVRGWDRPLFSDKLVGRILGPDAGSTAQHGIYVPNPLQHVGKVSSWHGVWGAYYQSGNVQEDLRGLSDAP